MLQTLRPMLTQAKNLPKIVELLEAHTELAEYEVARFYVLKSIGPMVAGLLESSDPDERLLGVRAIGTLFPSADDGARGGSADGKPKRRKPITKVGPATLLRRVIKDPDTTVRRSAMAAARRLGLEETAVPDSRYPAPRNAWVRNGGWNETGWIFGIRNPFIRRPARPVPAEVASVRAVFAKLKTPDDVAKLLGLKKAKELDPFMRAGSEAGSGYVEFTIPKATGGSRTICAPRAPLKRVQRTILRELLEKVPSHDAAHGFVKGRSVVSNAEPHQRAKIVIKIDLRDFFPTVHYYRVAGLFQYFGAAEPAARTLAAIVTHRSKLNGTKLIQPGVLPQGAPTSPAITNIVCRRMDARMTALSKKAGATYTRYADDLTFSFEQEPSKGIGRFLWWVDQIIQQEGFIQNAPKRRVLRRSNQQRITGVVVNSGMSVPREARRRFRAILQNIRNTSLAEQARGKPDFRSYLLGFASYVKMVQPEVGQALFAEVRAVLADEARKSTAK